ncbi:flavin reductase family protein [Acuticoccus sp. I52.16.1]|uniref:flavin reductase family protein n=1 Tax=Acuticoccus sp. I52.16.1 TaxID=2928472 RepID=UPI001FD4DFF6|nr:flavin reductase family protein [Acuticoccus sp. I52.16.1]UOM35283.1 flavin reductase family protein [Acuticoccus sp. I52.16.1]
MYYESELPSALTHDPFKAIVAPRPIGWIGTLNADGVPNLGPYSFFNAISTRPNLVAFSSEGWKHSAANAKLTGEFTFSLVTHALRHQMNASSANIEDGANEFDKAGIEMGTPRIVKAPFVKASPAAFECKVVQSLELTGIDGTSAGSFLTIGQVVAVHIDDDYIVDGIFDAQRARSVARCGYRNYATAETLWELGRPDGPAVPV